MVHLEGATVRSHECPGMHSGFCLILVARSRTLILFPESRTETIEWLVALENNISVLEASAVDEAKVRASP